MVALWHIKIKAWEYCYLQKGVWAVWELLSYPNTSVPSLLIPNWAFCTPLLSCTFLPSLTTLPRHWPPFVLKKPAFWAYRHPAAWAVSSTVALLLIPQPPGPPGSSTDTVLSGSWTTVMWPGNKDEMDSAASVTSSQTDQNENIKQHLLTSVHNNIIYFIQCRQTGSMFSFLSLIEFLLSS